MEMKKKGVSPVIAVVLMLAVACILAVVIYAWASGYLTGEHGKLAFHVESAKQITSEAYFISLIDTSDLNISNPSESLKVYIHGAQWVSDISWVEFKGNGDNNIDYSETWVLMIGTSHEKLKSGDVIKINYVKTGETWETTLP
jgi:flagellin-like protein